MIKKIPGFLASNHTEFCLLISVTSIWRGVVVYFCLKKNVAMNMSDVLLLALIFVLSIAHYELASTSPVHANLICSCTYELGGCQNQHNKSNLFCMSRPREGKREAGNVMKLSKHQICSKHISVAFRDIPKYNRKHFCFHLSEKKGNLVSAVLARSDDAIKLCLSYLPWRRCFNY